MKLYTPPACAQPIRSANDGRAVDDDRFAGTDAGAVATGRWVSDSHADRKTTVQHMADLMYITVGFTREIAIGFMLR